MLFSSPRWDEVTYWALDLETGGLDARRDAILAVGMVPVRQGTVRLGEGWRSLVRPRPEDAITAESVRVHQLVPGDVRDAPTLPDVLREVGRRLAGSVLLVHQAAIELPFLERAHRAVGLPWRAPPTVDTVRLVMRAQKRAAFLRPLGRPWEELLNLAAARAHYGLPDYGEHDPLTDAVATAELFLVLRRLLGARRLRDLR